MRNRSLLFVILLLFFGVLLAACDEDDAANEEATDTTTEAGPVSEDPDDTSELFTDPGPWVGQRVEVRGEVVEVVTDGSFVMSAEGGEGRIIVINQASPSLPSNVSAGATVEVTGEVVEFVAEDVQPKLQYELDEQTISDFQDEYVITATSIEAVS